MPRLLYSLAFATLAAFLGCNAATSTTSVAPGGSNGINGEPKAGQEAISAASQARPATEPMEGYVLIAPLRSTEAYLLNADKEVVQRWKSDHPPSGTAYLMENGDLIRALSRSGV